MSANFYSRLFACICGLFSASACAQTAFPNDVEPPARELLQATCPGQADPSGRLACICPIGSGLYRDDFDWELAHVIRGHFLSPTSDDAVLAMEGCEPHSENWGGAVLLTRKAEGWIRQWYKPGVIVSQCHKIQLQNQREILVCMGGSGAQGYRQTELYIEDMIHPGATLMAEGEAPFFSAPDDFAACGDASTIERSIVDSVEFSSAQPPVVSVTASMGKGPADGCVSPPLKRYRLEFTFDGWDYQLTSTRLVN